ncbi:MAG TPA: insulinase family protein [Clostridiales bacterium]|nr:insulinase family protein [Clostridiales bacterium]
MNKIVQQNIAPAVTFSNIQDDRFKTVKISATMFLPLIKETVAANAILPMLLTRSCKEYPDATSLNRKLNNLYGADISGYSRKMGESIALTVSISAIDDRYTMNNEKLSGELVHLLCSMLFNPKVENGRFCDSDFAQEKRQLIDAIDAEFNEKRVYAANRCGEIMFENEAFGIRRYGSKEAVESLTASEAFTAWENMLSTARVELMMIGSCDSTEALQAFTRAFSNINRIPVSISTVTKKNVDKVKTVTEEMDVAQCKLFMGFRTGAAEPDDTMAMRLAVAILGGTPNSKLFLNVREKYSLCYYCGSRYDRIKGIVTVDSGVEKENIDKAKQEILNQLQLLKNGELTDFEIQSTKMSIANSFNSMSDTISGTEGWYLSQMMDSTLQSPAQATEAMNAVTKDEIIKAAQTIVLDTVYVLASK